MGMKHFKAYTPSRRNMTVSTFEEITKKTPEKSLLAKKRVNSNILKERKQYTNKWILGNNNFKVYKSSSNNHSWLIQYLWDTAHEKISYFNTPWWSIYSPALICQKVSGSKWKQTNKAREIGITSNSK